MIGGLYSVPYFIDWDSKKAQLTKEILAQTGVDFEAQGKVLVKSFPSLKLSIDTVQASVNSGQQKIQIFQAGKVEAKFSLIQLLKGKVELSNLTFSNGSITVTQQFLNAAQQSFKGESKLSTNINLENFQIIFSGEKYNNTLYGVNLNISTPADFSNLNVQGSYQQHEIGDIINLNLQASSSGKNLLIKLFKKNGFQLNYTGSYDGSLANLTSKGNFNINLTSFSDSSIFISNPFPFLGFLTSDLISSSNTEIKGDLDVASGDLHATNISIKSPILSGSGQYDYITSGEKITSNMQFNFSTLDLKGLKFTASTAATGQSPGSDPQTSEETTQPGDSLLLGKYVGSHFFDLNDVSNNDSNLTMNISEIDYDGGSIKNFALNAAINQGKFKLSNLNFDFSTGTKLILSDVYSQSVDNQNVLIGNIQYSGGDLQSQIASTSIENYVKINPNTPFSFQSQVILARSEITFLGINANFGNGDLTGRWTVQTHDPTKNKYNVDLIFNNVDFNALQAKQFSDWMNNIFNGSAEKSYYASFVPLREIATSALAKLTFTNCKINKAVINNFSTELNINPAQLDFKNLKLDSNFANLTGEFIIASNALRPSITANLTGAMLDLDSANKYLFNIDEQVKSDEKVNPPAATSSANATASTAPDTTTAKEEPADSSTTATAASASEVLGSAQISADSPVSAVTNMPIPSVSDVKPYWSMEKFSYFRIDKFDGAINLTVNKLIYKNIEFDNMNLESTLRDNVWYINYLKANLYEGDLLAKGDINRKNTQVEASLSAALNNFNIENVKIGTDSIQNIKGKASVSGSFYTIGATPYDFMKELSSTITFATRDMTVQGMDLNRIILIAAKLESDVDKTDVMDQLDLAYKQGSTNYTAVDGSLTTNKGSMQTQNVTFVTQYSNGYLSSAIDIRYMIINSLIQYDFLPKKNQLQSLKMQILGPYDKLVKAVDDKNLVTYIKNEYGIPIPVVEAPVKPKSTEFIYQKIIQ